jgi:Family of unknown function (DUF6352)
MKDFWLSSGHHLLDRDEQGRLIVTDEFLKAYLARPELLPPADACAAEKELHHQLLMHQPRRIIDAAEIAAISDPDAQENWRIMIAFRDRLLKSPSLEAAYIDLVRDPGDTPPIFFNQVTNLVLRNVLDGIDDAFLLRAAELFFRPQRVTLHEGTLLLADAETIELHEHNRHASPLLEMLGGPAVTELEVLDEQAAELYFERSDAFDLVLNLGSSGRARRGLATAMTLWIRHLLGVEVKIEAVDRMEDENWAWFVGLDAEATRIGNALWRHEDIEPEWLERIIGLFRLEFIHPMDALPTIAGRPVWLILAMTKDSYVRMKPQNLVTGLPLRANAGVH